VVPGTDQCQGPRLPVTTTGVPPCLTWAAR